MEVCLIMSNKKIIKIVKRAIENCYMSYNVTIKIVNYEIYDGGRRLIFYVLPKNGTKLNSIFNLAKDVQVKLGLPLFKVFMDGISVCIAISGSTITENRLRRILQSDSFQTSTKKIPLAIGYDIREEMYIADLSELKHLLIGGATNTGKTVALYCLIFSIISKQSPNDVNLILVDTGAGDLEIFSNLPHLSCPIVKDEETGINVMISLFNEMERRKDLSDDELAALPSIVCVIDEFISLVKNITNKDTSKILINIIRNLLSRGRHTNIHMVLATQDTKVKNLGIDLGNIRARMAFSCGNVADSVNILGESGAENLSGNGTMLFKSPNIKETIHLQGAFLSKENREKVMMCGAYKAMLSDDCEYTNKFKISEVSLDASATQPLSDKLLDTALFEKNSELCKIIIWIFTQDTISSNKIKKHFKIGNRADEIIGELFQKKLVSDKDSNKPRIVIPKYPTDVPEEVMNFLTANKITTIEIEAAFATRNSDVQNK